MIRHMGSQKVPFQVDPQTGRASGPNQAQFVSYLGVLAQSKVSILIPDWDNISELDKNFIWEDIYVSYLFKCY